MKIQSKSLLLGLVVLGMGSQPWRAVGPNQQKQDPNSVQASDSAGSVQEITAILAEQATCWNDRNLEGFMATYWKSEKLTFSGGGRTTYGWQATFDRYKTKYPPEKMGTLTFDGQEITMLGSTAALVLGNWHLKTDDGKSDGNFSLVMQKMGGDWKIIHDHSSSLEGK